MLDVPEAIKAQFFNDSVKKAYYIRVATKNELYILGNDDIEKESVIFSESLCSQSKFRFGLCEDSILKLNMNLGNHKLAKGDKLTVYLDISLEGLPQYGRTTSALYDFPYYRIDIGEFYVDSCVKQTNSPLSKVTAYSQVNDIYYLSKQSKYLAEYPLGGISMLFNPFNYFLQNTKILQDHSELSNYISYVPVSLNVISISDHDYEMANYTLFSTMDHGSVTVYETGVVWYGGDVSASRTWTNDLYIVRTTDEEDLSVDEQIEMIIGYIPDSFERKNEVAEFLHMMEDASFHLDLPYRYLTDYKKITDKVNIGELSMGFLTKAYTSISIKITDEFGYTQVFHVHMYDSNRYSVDKVSGFWDGYTVQVDATSTSIYKKDGWTADEVYSDLVNMNIRSYMEDMLELKGYFGGIGRYGEFKIYDITRAEMLYPATDLYPDNAIYPSGETGTATVIPSAMISALFEDEYIKFGGISAEYKSGENTISVMEQIWDESLPMYELNDNQYLKTTIRTAEQVNTLISGLISALKNLVYMPVKVNMIGLPFAEKGDILYLRTKDRAVTTILLDRDMKGIQSLRDTIVAK